MKNEEFFYTKAVSEFLKENEEEINKIKENNFEGEIAFSSLNYKFKQYFFENIKNVKGQENDYYQLVDFYSALFEKAYGLKNENDKEEMFKICEIAKSVHSGMIEEIQNNKDSYDILLEENTHIRFFATFHKFFEKTTLKSQIEERKKLETEISKGIDKKRNGKVRITPLQPYV